MVVVLDDESGLVYLSLFVVSAVESLSICVAGSKKMRIVVCVHICVSPSLSVCLVALDFKC